MTGRVDQRDEIAVMELEFYKALDSVFHDMLINRLFQEKKKTVVKVY